MPTATKTKKDIPAEGFYFDEAAHRYYFDGRQLTGVTTVLSVLAKPALIAWAANQVIESLKEGAIKDETGLYYFNDEHLETARTAYARKRDKAADIGTLAHSWIEQWINAQMNKSAPPERDETLAIMTDNFTNWARSMNVKFLASEKVVYSTERWFAGTLDFIAKIGNKIFLGDVKTGSGIYSEMFMQTSGYQLALQEREPKKKIDGHIIVNITKKGELNVKEDYDYEKNKEGFLAALTLYRLINGQ